MLNMARALYEPFQSALPSGVSRENASPRKVANMPYVGGKHYPYDKAGKAAAATAKRKLKAKRKAPPKKASK